MIGIDLDNTIVCYDELFRRLAVEQRLVPPTCDAYKTAIRDHLRSIGQEGRWTELQGSIYGRRMEDAHPFPDVTAFCAACRAVRIPIAIVSQRTRYPYGGERHDLHAAARDWLSRHGFHDPGGIGLPTDRVYFEETKEAKLARIAALGCTHFIDDLPELLTHPLFPSGVQRILFDPHGLHGPPAGIDVARSWSSLLQRLVGTPHRLPGGGNNRVYRVDTVVGPVLLKEYFRHAEDRRDRLGAEQALLHFAWSHGVRTVPQPLACAREAGLGIHEFLSGESIAANTVHAAHVDEAAAFFVALNRHRHEPDAARLPIASEACFTIAAHMACVDRRLARLGALTPDSDMHREAMLLIGERLVPAWRRLRSDVMSAGMSLDSPLPSNARVISPSDFGFHNCIATAAGLKFFDFEYAGWDDPAKTVCDFFCQPAVPVGRVHMERFLKAMATVVDGDTLLRERVNLLLPVYEIKWCCIMLNDFLPVEHDRRAFARGPACHEAMWSLQLKKVNAALARLGA